MDEAAVFRAALRHDALSAPIGFLLLGLGLAAGALALALYSPPELAWRKPLLAAHAAQPPERIAEALLARVAEWTGRSASFEDDLTFVVAGVTELC